MIQRIICPHTNGTFAIELQFHLEIWVFSLIIVKSKHKDTISQLKSDNNCFFENCALKFITHSKTPGSKMVSLTADYAYNLPISC